jgi:hypothetical protein
VKLVKEVKDSFSWRLCHLAFNDLVPDASTLIKLTHKYGEATVQALNDALVSEQNKRGGLNMQAYRVKCRAKKEMKDAKGITMKNGKPATQGVCPTCGTKMFRIGKA